MIKFSEVKLKICTEREMHIKCWLDKGFNKLNKINKKSRFLCMTRLSRRKRSLVSTFVVHIQ